MIVFTDDVEITEIAKTYDAQVPFMNSTELSNDYVDIIPVIRHAVQWSIEAGCNPKQICCIYATAPFVTVKVIKTGFNIIQQADVDFAFSVTSYAFPIQRAIHLTEQGRVEMFHPQQFNTHSQDLEEAYHDAGQFYWRRAKAWLEEQTIFGSNSVPIQLPCHRVQDIDTTEDWLRAELMFKTMQAIEMDA